MSAPVIRLSAAEVRANTAWIRDVDIPDALGWQDFHKHADASLTALEIRLNDAGNSQVPRLDFMIYPKPNGEPRRFPILDPLTELGYRNAVKPAARRLSGSLPGSVFSRRVESGSSYGFRAEPWRPARQRYKGWLKRQRQKSPNGGRGELDVQSCFPTIDRDTLLWTTLPSLGCEQWEIQPVSDFLERLAQRPGLSTGLPIGQEMSSILGTAALVPLDRCARRFEYGRWVDDITVCTESEGMFYDEAHGSLSKQLERIGQVFNNGKTLWLPWSVDRELGMSGDVYEEYDDGTEGPYFRLLSAAELGDYEPIRGALAELSASNDSRGMSVISEFPWVARRFPKECAKYAAHVWDQTDSVDGQWVLSSLMERLNDQDFAPLNLHLLHTFRKRPILRDIDKLLERAVDPTSGLPVPLREQMMAAGVRHLDSKKSSAIEIAFEMGRLNTRRALLGELNGPQLSRLQRSAIDELASETTGLRPLASLLGV